MAHEHQVARRSPAVVTLAAALAVALAHCASAKSAPAPSPQADAGAPPTTPMPPAPMSATPAPAASCGALVADAENWRLHAEGTRLLDPSGRAVTLRGVNAGGRSKFAPYVPFDFAANDFDAALAAYMDRAAAWGIDVMRVPFTWAAVEPTQGADDATYLAHLDAFLDAAWARRIWTVVDFHQDVYSEVFCGDGFPAWTLPAPQPAPHHDCPAWSLEYLTNQDVIAAFDAFWADGSKTRAAFASLWDRVAKRYADRPGVIGFEVINEPGWGSKDVAAWEPATLAPFFTDMVTRIHAAAPEALVFIDLPGIDGISGTTALPRPQGDGIVFAPHAYELGTAQSGLPGDAAGVLAKLTHWRDVGAAWNVPVFVGEFGTDHGDPAAPAYIQSHFDALDALSIGGTVWEYSVASESWNSESMSVVAADGTEYPVAAALVRAYPRAIAGANASFAFDAATKSFTLSYAPTAGGVTEIAVPTRLTAAPAPELTGACFDATTPGRLLLRPTPGAAEVSLRITQAPR